MTILILSKTFVFVLLFSDSINNHERKKNRKTLKSSLVSIQFELYISTTHEMPKNIIVFFKNNSKYNTSILYTVTYLFK